MSKALSKYVQSKKYLLRHFNCSDDYHLTVLDDCKWLVKHEDGVSFLTYWRDDDSQVSAVIVRKGGEPLIYRTDELTMIIAIDCIKIAFITKNNNEL